MLYVSTNLCHVPFISHTDATRLQMASRQLQQTVTTLQCDIPRIIGNNYRYLSDSSRMYRYVAPANGEIIYINKDIMLIVLSTVSGDIPIILEIPNTMTCSEIYATKLRYKREMGTFECGDILYEYDCFKNQIPTYGYNLMTAYMPFFGYNYADAFVISEEISERIRSTKCETIIIPIYTYSLFKSIYNDIEDYGILPGIGRKVKENIVLSETKIKGRKNPIQYLKSLNLTDFTEIIGNQSFSSTPITTKINDSIVEDIKIHKIDKNAKLIDQLLQQRIDRIYNNYISHVRETLIALDNLLGVRDYVRHIASQYYLILDSIKRYKIETKELVYLMEIKLIGDNGTTIGDKLACRVANKGVVSFIIPKNLSPIAVHSNTPIDIISGAISVYSRMNLSQIIEGMIAKAIVKAEKEILQNKNNNKKISEILYKISEISELFHDDEYASAIQSLSNEISISNTKRDQFISSILNIGLYFEAPNFANFNMGDLYNLLLKKFNTKLEEPLLIKKDLLDIIKKQLNSPDLNIPDHDIIIDDIACAPVYFQKLKQEAALRLSARDFGSYKSTSKQPSQGRDKGSIIGQSSRIGNMEFEGLFSASLMRTIDEFRTVKSDCHNLKVDLARQVISTGQYHLPNVTESKSFTKMLIDSYIEFLND